MNCKAKIFIILSCFLFNSIFAESFFEACPSSLQTIEGMRFFRGDSHGEFAGDLVVMLSDGSEWKVHPGTNIDVINQWSAGEPVCISVRTSHYWFKREHKFLINNLIRRKSVKAMLVKHGYDPLTIVYTSVVYPTDTYMMPVYWEDDEGNEYVAYYIEVPCNYKKDLLLSDGTTWIISNNFKQFKAGCQLYFGVDFHPESFDFFLIIGKEREAIWTWATFKGE